MGCGRKIRAIYPEKEARKTSFSMKKRGLSVVGHICVNNGGR